MPPAAEHDFGVADEIARHRAQSRPAPSSPMPTMDSQRGNAAVSGRNAAGSGGLNVMPRILILGGTTEARGLAERLAVRPDLDLTLSLAGRTMAPVGAAGAGPQRRLRRRCWAYGLSRARARRCFDRRHAPLCQCHFGECRGGGRATTHVPFVALRRPPWHKIDGDHWTEVSDVSAAVAALGKASRRVFVALGRNELAPFSEAPQHYYLIRSVDPVAPPLALPHVELHHRPRSLQRGRRSRSAQGASHRSRWSPRTAAAAATYGKIAAARALGLEVIMLRRPALPDAPAVATVDEALAWLDQALTLAAARGV